MTTTTQSLDSLYAASRLTPQPGAFQVRQKVKFNPARSLARSAEMPGILATFPDVPPTLPAQDELPGHPDGLIKRVDADKDLIVRIPTGSHHEGDDVNLILNGRVIPVAAITLQEAAAASFDRVIPVAELTTDNHLVTYQVIEFGDTYAGSPAVKLQIDRRAPGGTKFPSLVFSEQVLKNGVTLNDLQADVLEFEVAPYYDMRDGDVIEVLSSANPVAGSWTAVPSAAGTVPAGGEGQSLPLGISKADLEAIGDDVHFFTYNATDLAGNQSPPAANYITALTILIGDAPADSDLLEPAIAQHDDDVLSETDARKGISVAIPGIVKLHDLDQIVFYLSNGTDTRPTPPIEITGNLGLDPILEFDVLYDMVASLGENYTGSAYYELYRGNAKLATSPVLTVAVDLRKPGGVDPDPSTPEHENLTVGTAYGDSNVANVISATDLQSPARFVVPWLAVDGSEPMADGDWIEVQWGSVAVTPRTINAGDVAARRDIDVPVPALDMQNAGAGAAVQVSYRLVRPVAGTSPPQNNSALAVAQSVQVISQDLAPGGPGGLVAGEFPQRNVAQNVLNRSTVEAGVSYDIPLNYVNIAVGDEITLTLQGYEGLTDPVGGTTTPNTNEVYTYVLDVGDLPDDPNDPGASTKKHVFPIPTSYFSRKWVIAGSVGRGAVTANYTIKNAYATGNGLRVWVGVAVGPL